MPTITLEPLSFQNKTIIASQLLSISPFKWTCLMGHSGIGKTTFLRYLAGLLPNPSPLMGESIGYMTQTPALFPWMTALQNVYVSDLLKGNPPRAQHAQDLLHYVELSEHEKKRPKELSQGMQQRVALAEILYRNTSWVLLDEPFSALDFETRLQMHSIVKKWLAGKTVLHVTHDIEDAKALADHVWTFKGRPAIIEEA